MRNSQGNFVSTTLASLLRDEGACAVTEMVARSLDGSLAALDAPARAQRPQGRLIRANCGSRQSQAREGSSSIFFGVMFHCHVAYRSAPCA